MTFLRRTGAVLACSLIAFVSACEAPVDDTFDEGAADTALPQDMVFDLEYKKLEGNKLIIKQIRPVPEPDKDARITTFLLARPRRVCTSQGEGDDLFASHRLKSIASLDSRTVRLTAANLKLPLLARIDAQINALDGSTVTVSGDPAKLPGAKHQVEEPPLGFQGKNVVDSWTVGTGAAKRTFALALTVSESAPTTVSPIVLLDDTRIALAATYATPAPILVVDLDNNGLKPATQTEDGTFLGTCPEDTPLEERIQQRELRHGSVVIDSKFRYADAGDTLIKTASLGQWIETRITGLTTEPIVLTGFFAQTFEPGHHNFFENFLFEPALEPGIPTAILQELKAKDIRQIVVMNADPLGSDNASFFKLGSSGQYEPLP